MGGCGAYGHDVGVVAVVQAIAAAVAGVTLTVFASSEDCERIDLYSAAAHQIVYSGDSPLAILQALVSHQTKCLPMMS